MGSELTEEPFRWDHRLFALVLRLGGITPSAKVTAGMSLPSDSSPIDAMCVATGGLSFLILKALLISLLRLCASRFFFFKVEISSNCLLYPCSRDCLKSLCYDKVES